MAKLLFALSLGFGGIILAMNAANAQAANATCADRASIVERLEGRYGETRRSVGLNRNNGVMEVFASTETGSWTILITMPTGVTCLVAAGEAFQGFEAPEIAPAGLKI